MKIFFDLLPIILFFASYKWAGSHAEQAAQWLNHYLGFAVSGGSVGVTEAPVLLATVVVVVATMLQILVLKALGKRVDKMLWAGLAVVVVLGGLTLWFHDETFIKWKPSVLYWLMGAVLAGGLLFFRKNFIKSLMGTQMELPDPVWRTLCWAWALFFAGMGVLNLWVAFNFDTDTWVTFKLFGGMGLMLVFVVGQALYLSRHMQSDDKP